MKKSVSILGCGWLGQSLAYKLIERGYSVSGSTTSEDKFINLKSRGIIPFLIDIGDRSIDLSNFLSSDILVIAIPSKNIAGFKHLISQIEISEINKVIFFSSTSVYPFINGIATEETRLKESPLTEIEKLINTNTKFESTIIRFGGLFGYNRKPGNFIKENNIITNPEGYVNLIHRDDCIGIIEKLIDTNTWNEVFNACADTHPKRSDFYAKEMKKQGKIAATSTNKSPKNYKIISSDKLKNELNYTFKYGDLMAY